MGWETYTGFCEHAGRVLIHSLYGVRITEEGRPGRRRESFRYYCHDCEHWGDKVENPDIHERIRAQQMWRGVENCQHPTPHIERSLARNGQPIFYVKCGICDEQIRVRKGAAKQLHLQRGFEVFTGHDSTDWNPLCERCGAAGTELHHYAPRSLFDDADDWPTGYLCRPCHTKWHQLTRTGAFDERCRSAS